MSDKQDLLIELGTEDLPAKLLLRLSEEFGLLVCEQLKVAGLSFTDHSVYCTPRRLAVRVNQLDAYQQDQIIERKGPSKEHAFDQNGKPTQAAIGFARSCNVEVDQLDLKEIDGQTKLFFQSHRAGLNTSNLLQELLFKVVNSLSVPKRMKWDDSSAEFIRPLRWLLVIFGSEVVPLELYKLRSNNFSYGHRFHYPEKIIISHPGDYVDSLNNKGRVLVDFKTRQNEIINQVEHLAKTVNSKPTYSQDLLNEITNLVEWPSAMLAEFNEVFLSMPKELLISTMQDKQKYIPLVDNDGELLSKFIIISNIESKQPDVVKSGNEKVITPRLEDASFFWHRDLNKTLKSKQELLKSLVFEKKLGSVYDKCVRISKLSKFISSQLNIDAKLTRQAAMLCKCDLLTEMVGEFPELQGVAGRYLALNDKEDVKVAQAIEEHYLPKQAGGNLPSSELGKVIAIADRIDTLVGIFAIGKKPSGLKDPYGLRRASLAVLRIVIEANLKLDLLACLSEAAKTFTKDIKAPTVVNEVFDYILDRLRAYYTEKNIDIDIIDSVLANRPTAPRDIAARIQALCNFRKLPNAASLSAANKRIRNILKKTERDSIGRVNKKLFTEDAESALHAAVEQLSDEVEVLFQQHEYEQALNKLADLRKPVDTFFDDVMVMAEDAELKKNRISLLAKIDSLFMQVADFSRLQNNN